MMNHGSVFARTRMPTPVDHLSSSRILVVDDNQANLALVMAVLEVRGCTLLTAESAEQAQVLLRTEVPDVILLDIALPGMDGLSLTRWLKGDARLKHVPVIALTAFAMEGDEDRAMAAGCDGYITKPIDTRALPGEVERVLLRSAGLH
jgi:CheY-like chemotaxis protein